MQGFRCLLFLIFNIVFNFSGSVDCSRDVPKSLKVCNRDDYDNVLNNCLKKAMQDALVVLRNGIPEVGMKSIDPYRQKQLFVEYKRNQFYGRAGLVNMVAYGLGQSKVKAVRSNLNDDFMEMEVDLYTKKLIVQGLMVGEGRFNTIVLKTSGNFTNTMYGLETTIHMVGKLERIKGEDYMKINKFRMRPEIRDMDVKIPDISNNIDFNEYAKRFANTNWEFLYAELITVIDGVWERIGIALSNKIFLKVPYNKLFPILE